MNEDSTKYWLTKHYRDKISNFKREHGVSCCSVCGSSSDIKRLIFDYDKESDTIFGLLCPQCKKIIDLCKGNTDILMYVSIYLEKNNG